MTRAPLSRAAASLGSITHSWWGSLADFICWTKNFKNRGSQIARRPPREINSMQFVEVAWVEFLKNRDKPTGDGRLAHPGHRGSCKRRFLYGAFAAHAFVPIPDNLLATPHIGFVAEDLHWTFYDDAAAAIGAWMEKQVPSPRASEGKGHSGRHHWS